MNPDWQAILRRVARTTLQAFFGICAPATILSWLTGAAEVDRVLLITAAFTAAMAAASLLWNVLLDPSPIPSLEPVKTVTPLHDRRVIRLLDPNDDLSDLSNAEKMAVEQRGRDLQSQVRSGLYKAREARTGVTRG